ncbi:hypothetical protein SAMN05216311_106227 [Chitinophaga sp. CF418]|nr:hypothetical protein SAMN05216311_106227 [Chitinophaga sp. CF418]
MVMEQLPVPKSLERRNWPQNRSEVAAATYAETVLEIPDGNEGVRCLPVPGVTPRATNTALLAELNAANDCWLRTRGPGEADYNEQLLNTNTRPRYTANDRLGISHLSIPLRHFPQPEFVHDIMCQSCGFRYTVTPYTLCDNFHTTRYIHPITGGNKYRSDSVLRP